MKIPSLPELPPVAILSGGLGTRMRPATDQVPKALLPVAGEPFLGHQLRALAAQGVRRAILCCGHLSEQIIHFAGDGSRFGIHVHYSYDGSVPLGTGGALRTALPLLGREFFVLYGDSYLTESFSEVYAAYKRLGRPALMTAFRNRGLGGTSNLEVRDERVFCYGKAATPRMEHIDYGLGVYAAQVFEPWPAGARFSLTDVQTALAAAGEIAAFEVNKRFYEIGSPQGLADTDAYLRAQMAGRANA